MLRVVAVLTLILTVIFGMIAFVITQFAPETAVLATYQITPDRGQAIYLLDVQRGLTYFTGLLTRPGNNSMWSADGRLLVTVQVNPMPASLNTLNLTTGERQSYPMQAPNGRVEWEGHPTKFAYSSALNRGSLIIYDRETGEEVSYLHEHGIHSMRWLPESDTLIVTASPQTTTPTSNLYAIDTLTNDVRLLREALNLFFVEILDNPLRIVYNDGNQIMSFSPETPDDVEVITSVAEDESLGFQPLPSGDYQLIVSSPDRKIWQVDLATGERVLMREAPAESDNMYRISWSPDGETSVWLYRPDDVSTTLRIVREGESQREIRVAAPLEVRIWSPDSRYVLVVSPPGTFNVETYLIDITDLSFEQVMRVSIPLLWQPAP